LPLSRLLKNSKELRIWSAYRRRFAWSNLDDHRSSTAGAPGHWHPSLTSLAGAGPPVPFVPWCPATSHPGAALWPHKFRASEPQTPGMGLPPWINMIATEIFSIFHSRGEQQTPPMTDRPKNFEAKIRPLRESQPRPWGHLNAPGMVMPHPQIGPKKALDAF